MKYIVPVTVEISGQIEVEASSPAEALELAQKNYKGVDSINMPSFEIDFAYGDDLSEVTESEEDE